DVLERLIAGTVGDRRALHVAYAHVAARVVDLEGCGLRHVDRHVDVRIAREAEQAVRDIRQHGAQVHRVAVAADFQLDLLEQLGRGSTRPAVDLHVAAPAAAYHQVAGSCLDHDPLDVGTRGVRGAVGGVIAVVRMRGGGQGAGEEGGASGSSRNLVV